MAETTAERVTPSVGGPRGPTGTTVLFVVVGVVLVAVFAAAALQFTHGDGGAVGVLAAALRLVRYTGSLVAVGGLVFVAVIRPPDVVIDPAGLRAAKVAAFAAVAATLVAVPLQAWYLAADPSAAVDAATMRAVLDSGFGRSAVLALAGLAAVLIALRSPASPLSVGLGAGGGLAVLGSFLLTGHTATSQPQALTLTANLTHTIAGAVWLGGLVLLGLALREQRASGDAASGSVLVSRFSAVATVAVVAVMVGGGALAWVEVRSVEALFTPYGAVLAAKIGLAAAVIALGAYNNRRLVEYVRQAGPAGWSALRRIVSIEVAGLVAVLAVTAVLVNVTPARVEAGVDMQVTRFTELGPDHNATLVIDPARAGSNEVHLYVEHERRVIGDTVEDVTMGFVPPGGSGPASVVEPAQVGPGHWLHLGSEMDQAGEWTVTLSAAAGGEQRTAAVAVEVIGDDLWLGP